MFRTPQQVITAVILLPLFLLCGFQSNCLGQKPEILIQTGHPLHITQTAFSQDGLALASGSEDGAIKLWDVSTGRELRAFLGHSTRIIALRFTPDDKVIVSCSEGGLVKLWDVGAGIELKSFTTTNADTAAVSPDGGVLATCWGGGTSIRLWDLSSGKETRRLLTSHDSDPGLPTQAIAFSIDGKVVAGGNPAGQVRLWEVSTGKELPTLRLIKAERGSDVCSLKFSPNGRVVASGSFAGNIVMWDLITGQALDTLRWGTRNVDSISFSPDGGIVAGGGRRDGVKLWETATGKLLRSLRAESSYTGSVSFSPDGQLLAGANGSSIQLWNSSDGVILRNLRGQTSPIMAVAMSPDSKLVAAGNDNGSVSFWNVSLGMEPKTFKAHDRAITCLAFSFDGKKLISGSGNTSGMGEAGEVKVWEVSTGNIMISSPRLDGAVTSVGFSPDGRKFAYGTVLDEVELWDLTTGKMLRRLGEPIEEGGVSNTKSLSFSPDSKTLATSYFDGAKIWDVETGQELRSFDKHSDHLTSVAFSPDGKMLACGVRNGGVKLWEVSSGEEIRTLDHPVGFYNLITFSPDGSLLASGGGEKTRLWAVASGKEVYSFEGNVPPSQVAFSADGKILAIGDVEGSIKLWDLANGRQLASMLVLEHNNWAVISPDGLFDGSSASWAQMLWRFSPQLRDVAPVELFFNEFFYPNLLADLCAGQRPRARKNISQKDRRQSQISLSLAQNEVAASPITQRRMKVRIQITKSPAGTKDARLFRNGALLKVWRGDVLRGRASATLEMTVPIVAGENRLTAYAFNHDNIKSSDAALIVTGANSLKRSGSAYILAVGVNQYANARYNLKYAVADAQDFAEELKRQQTKLANYEQVEIMSLSDRDATKANILKLLSELAAKIQPEDAVIIYFAGHGTARGNRFYLVPHDLGYKGNPKRLDEAGLQSILSHSISDEELERAIEGIDAGQLLLVIDACNSGQALETDEKRRGPMNSKGLAQLAYEKGMYILTAAQSYQAALEASKLGHGYLTYALVEEGLKTPAADAEPRDNQLLLREWLDYATTRVPQMQQETIDRGARGIGLQIVFLEGDEKIKDPSKRKLQRPRVFYRRETETTPLVIAKP